LTSIQTSFQAIYGLEFDTEVELFRFGTPCDDALFSVRVHDAWSFVAEMDCGDDAVAGGLGMDVAAPMVS
jgi:hypothetical protein